MSKNKDKNENLKDCPDFAKIVKDSSTDKPMMEQIARCFSDKLLSYAKYRCRNDSIAYDAFQEAMIATMKYLDTYRGDAPIEYWLKRIVSSSCSRLRSGKKNDPNINQSLDDDTNYTQYAMPGDDQEMTLMYAQRIDLIRKKINALKEPDRSLMMLHDMEETPIKELAGKFDMTRDAIKSRLKRSRATIREALLNKN